MSSWDKRKLTDDLTALIIDECEKDDEFTAEEVDINKPLMGPESQLELDSLDTLQISLALLKCYGVRINGSKDGRIAFSSIDALANFIIKESTNAR
ncbi:hypothetical protein MNBD_GAMMA17-1632 [hydrothermal vent metagenome]|uniref:Carrier domain-containing protein n=1 Tax=hydrothermal vent metagenome TaxID=652676 RepID=A0A3B1ABA4_9ZZZZ